MFGNAFNKACCNDIQAEAEEQQHLQAAQPTRDRSPSVLRQQAQLYESDRELGPRDRYNPPGML